MSETKEQAKHTPGPWHYDEETMTVRVKEWKGNPFMADYRGSIIADFQESHGGRWRMESSGLEGLKDAIEANARLIAAAPELLEVCKGLLAAIRDRFPGIEKQVETAAGLQSEYHCAVAAIAKAEGR